MEILKKEIKYIEMNGKTDIWINYKKSRSFLWFHNERFDDYASFYETKEEFDKLKSYIKNENVEEMRQMMKLSTSRRSLFDKPVK